MNDEVINVWLGHIVARNTAAKIDEPNTYPNVYIHKTNFYARMCIKMTADGGEEDVFDYVVRCFQSNIDLDSGKCDGFCVESSCRECVAGREK